MSALVSITICTSDRKIHRFTDPCEAFEFQQSHTKVSSIGFGAPDRSSVRQHGENRRRVLACLAEHDSTMVDLATNVERSVSVIKRLVDSLEHAGLIEIAHRGNRGQRLYRITDSGRAEVASHA